jgi:glycosyltransferase involved in cell wall biosynthesis
MALLEANSITGTAKAVIEFAREARADADNRMEVSVANFVRGSGAVQNALTRTLENEGIPLHYIQEKGRFDSAVLARLRELTEKLQPDIIWTNSVKSHFLVSVSGVQRRCQWMAYHHGYTATDLKMRVYNQLDRLSLRHADLALTVCQPFAAQLAARGVDRKRIRVQHMPIRAFEIDPEKVWQVRSEFGIAAGAKVILTIGRLSREKGHADLVRAFAQLRADNTTLVVVGDGPERAALQQLAGPAVVFTGHRDDIASFYGLADIFVLPSYSEGTPNVILEAMAAHVPVIATNVGGIPELAVHGESALLAPAADPTALQNAMRQLLDSPELRQRLASAAEAVVASHSPELYFESLAAHFRGLIKTSRVTADGDLE